MKNHSVQSIAAIILVSFCLSTAQGAKLKKGGKTMQTSGTAAGTFTFNPKETFLEGADELKTIKLNHAHVQSIKDPFDDKKRLIRVVLSDLPISDEVMDDETGVAMLVQTGKLQAIEFFLTSEGMPSGGSLLYQMKSRTFNEQSFRFEQKTFNDKTAAGKILMDERNVVTDKPQHSCTVTFSAPVQLEPKPTAQGPAAAASEPGKLVAEYMRAMRAHDMATLKRVCLDEEMQRIEGPEGKEYIQSINDWLKAGMKIARVYEYPNRARVDVEMSDGTGTASLNTIRVNGSWKIK